MKSAALQSNNYRCCSPLTFLFGLIIFPFCVTAEVALPNLGNGVGACVIDLERHQIVAEHNAATPLKPASIQKLILSGAVLEELGPEHHFFTEVSVSGRKGGLVENLSVRGGGDPSMTTERLWLLARQIVSLGIKQIKTLTFDDSAFDAEKSRDGQRAYLTGSSALSLNFNSITVRACPTLPGEHAEVRADPWESGARLKGEIKTALRGARGVVVDALNESKPDYLISGTVAAGNDCSNVYRSVPAPERYFAETLAGYLRYLGVVIPREFQYREAPSSEDVVIRFSSIPLSQILRDMNLFSSNFIAEQLLSALGAEARNGKEYFSRQRGLERLQDYMTRVAGARFAAEIADGSGLSHENRVPTRFFCQMIDRMYTRFDLMTEFLGSLPASGRNGTLRDRDFGSLSTVVRAKTGSLNGVSSLAGVVVTSAGRHLGFAIVQNRPIDKGQAVVVEDNLVRGLLR